MKNNKEKELEKLWEINKKEMEKRESNKKSSIGEQLAKGLVSIFLGLLGFVLFFIIVIALVRWMCRSEGV